MKLFFFVLSVGFVSASHCLAQESRLPYEIAVDIEQDQVTEAEQALVRSALGRAAGSAGAEIVLADAQQALFISSVRLTPIAVSVARSPAVTYVSEVMLEIGTSHRALDRSFGSESMVLKGLGRTGVEASTQALRALSGRHVDLTGYYGRVTESINTYFEEACDGILEKSALSARSGEADAALYALSLVPEGAEDCHADALALTSEIIETRLEQQCSASLVESRAIWAASRSRASAMKVAASLAASYPGSHCDAEIEGILAEVSSVIRTYDRQAAERIRQRHAHRMRVYEDALTDQRRREAQMTALAVKEVEARRQVGVEMAKAMAKADGRWLAIFR